MKVNTDNKSIDKWWNVNEYFNMNNNNGIQIWTVPATGLYNITIAGAAGGRASSASQGYGALIDLSYRLVKGENICY